MLHVTLIVNGLADFKSQSEIINRLRAIGYIEMVRIQPNKNTINFKYATFRDMDAATTVLNKMGLSIIKIQYRLNKKKNLTSKNTATDPIFLN